MAWAKFDDRWATHPKLLAAGLEAKGLDASGICYSAGQETDGFVPDTALVVLCAGHRSPHKVAQRLVEVGRWMRDDDRKGYVIHDFDCYNFTRAQGEDKRRRDAERKRAGRERQGRDDNGRFVSERTDGDVHPDSDGIPDGQPDTSAGSPTVRPPVPTRPDPTRRDKSSSNHHVGGAEGAEEEELRDRVATAVGLVADRRLAAREGPPITNAAGWLRKVRSEVASEHSDALRSLAERGLSGAAIAAEIESQSAVVSPYQPWEPPVLDEPVTEPEAGRARLAELRRAAG